MHGRTDASLHVLVVCTANCYRSPLAEFMLGSAARDRGLNWTIESAGTRATPDQRLNADIESLLVGRQIDLDSGWRSHRIDAGMIARADVVLTAERSHRAAIVRMAPASLRRTFLLGQFARLLEACSVGSGGDVVGAATEARAHIAPFVPTDEIVDPAGRSSRALAQTADTIQTLVEMMVNGVAGDRHADPKGDSAGRDQG